MKLLAVLLCLVTLVQGQVQVRLSGNGANSSQGRVEVFYNGSWGTICNDQFDVNDAGIVCKMLGYSHGGAVVSVQAFGPGTGRIWMDNLNCDGSELTIDQCQFNGWGNTNCNHTEDVGVICLYPTQPQRDNCPASSLPPQEGDVRLVGPTNRTGLGFVQIFHNNSWGAVCDDLWDVQDAKVVCRMLCFSTENAHAGTPSLLNYVRPNASSRFVLDDVECIGNESHLSHCKHKPWGRTDCIADTEYAIVACDVDQSHSIAPDVNVTCDNGQITAIFDRQIQPDLHEDHLSVLNTSTALCNVRKNRTTKYISISIPFEQCDTNITTNATHIIYANDILYDYTRNSREVIRVNTYRIEVCCIFARNSTHYRGMVPQTEEIKRIAAGEFEITMDFYKNYSFVSAYANYPVTVTLGQWMNVALTLHEYNTDLKLVVPDCVASPTTSDTHPFNYPLFVDKCQQYSDVEFFPLNTTSYGFRYKTFRFVNYGEVYIHCEAIVCHIDEKDTQCDRSCDQTTVRRKRRSASSKFIYHISSPPMKFHSKEEETAIIRGVDTQSEVHTSTLTVNTSKLFTTPETTTQSTSQKSSFKISTQQPKTSPRSTTLSYPVSTAESTPRMTSTTHSFPNSSVSMSARSSSPASPSDRNHTTKTFLNNNSVMSSKLQSFSHTSNNVTGKMTLPTTSKAKRYTTTTSIYPIHVSKTTKRSVNIRTEKLIKNGDTINRDVPLLVALQDIRLANSCPAIRSSYYVSQLMFWGVFLFFTFDRFI